ncbi:MAG: FHA domain-containing protein [Anaerolineae bacterium]|nr:MAG: FHA domain-containing protein [Anaerolineae bacterium]
MERQEENPLFIAQSGPLDGQRWVIRESLVIGRDPDCDVIVTTPDKQVSRRHAQITVTAKGLTVEDLGSKNGTHVNGQRIEGPTILQDGDTVQVALAQQFVYLSSDATVPLEMGTPGGAPLGKGLLRLDPRARRVWVGNHEVAPPLSVAQFTMMELLYNAHGMVVSRNELIQAVWGEEQAYDVSNQALDALVRRLRDRLAEADDDHEFVVTVRGHGLRLENPS